MGCGQGRIGEKNKLLLPDLGAKRGQREGVPEGVVGLGQARQFLSRLRPGALERTVTDKDKKIGVISGVIVGAILLFGQKPANKSPGLPDCPDGKCPVPNRPLKPIKPKPLPNTPGPDPFRPQPTPDPYRP